MFSGPWPLRRGGRLNWLLLPLSRGLRVCLFFVFFLFFSTFVCVFYFPASGPLGAGVAFIGCTAVIWGVGVRTLHLILFWFLCFQCLVGGSAECRFSRARPTVLFQNVFGSWNPCEVAHVDIVLASVPSCPAIHHHRLGTPG